MPLDPLVNVIDTLQKRIATHRQSFQQNETRTRMALIDPLLTVLGWDVSDPSLVTPEYSVGKGRADYALNGPETIPAAIVEAKQLDHTLDDDERIQMLNYAYARGVRYAAVTDGNIWELYEVFKQVPSPLEDRRRLNLKIVGTPAHKLALELLLLWQPNLASGAPTAAQEPVSGTKTEQITAEALHQSVDTPLPQTGSAPPSVTTDQPRQGSSSSRASQYCVDGKTWRECRDATLLMMSIVEWCAQQHVHGEDDYYENLSRACFKNHPILIREKVTERQKQYYSRGEINGWHIFKNRSNHQKKTIIDEILRACIRENGTSPVQGQDLQVKMPND